MRRRSSAVKRPIVRRLIIWIGFPLLLVYAAVAVTNYVQSSRAAVERMNSYLLELTNHHAAVLDSRFKAISQTPLIIAENIEAMRLLNEPRLYGLMERRLAIDPGIFGMSISFEPYALDPGRERCSPLSLIHISEPPRLLSISYAVFCLKKKNKPTTTQSKPIIHTKNNDAAH